MGVIKGSGVHNYIDVFHFDSVETPKYGPVVLMPDYEDTPEHPIRLARRVVLEGVVALAALKNQKT